MTQVENAQLSPTELDYLCEFVRKEAAIVLTPEKAYLIEARLGPLTRREGFDSLPELVTGLRGAGAGSDLPKKVVDAMTTNETSFFRDIHPFEALRKHVLPHVIEGRRADKTLNLWCAAASSGQEPFTIAMILREYFPELADWTIEYWATDISSEMLVRCAEGRYTQMEVNRGLPAPLLVKYFRQEGREWIVSEEIRDMIAFREMNLIEPWPLMPRMDIVFIRNVLIYFDIETKQDILNRIRRTMHPAGVLFLGSTETTINIDNDFERRTFGKSTIYVMPGNTLPVPD